MIPSGQKQAKIILALGITVFLLTGFLGLSHFSMSMNMEGDTTMSDCPFMSGMAICNMSILEHIATWQSMFAHIQQPQNPMLVLLFLLSVSLVMVGWIKRRYPPPKNSLEQCAYFFGREHVLVIKPLQDLFSNGILNPKLF